MGWLYLMLAIVFETLGTIGLKLSNGFTSILPSIGTVIAYILCFFFLGYALKTIDISVAYAIWGAVGVVIVASIGIVFFQEPINAVKAISIFLIILGTCGLRLSH